MGKQTISSQTSKQISLLFVRKGENRVRWENDRGLNGQKGFVEEETFTLSLEAGKGRGLFIASSPTCSLLKPGIPTHQVVKTGPPWLVRALGLQGVRGWGAWRTEHSSEPRVIHGFTISFHCINYSWNMKPAIIIQKPCKNSYLEENYNFLIKYEHSK